MFRAWLIVAMILLLYDYVRKSLLLYKWSTKIVFFGQLSHVQPECVDPNENVSFQPHSVV